MEPTKADILSPYWGFNFSSRDGLTSSQLYAKRDDAMQREPLSLSLETEFGPDDDELRREFAYSLDYGVTKRLILPSHVVSSFTKEGPEWFAGEVGSGELHIIPAEDNSRDIRIDVTSFNADGKRLAAVSARRGRFVAGNLGGTLEFSTPGGLSLGWRLPKGAGEGTVRADFAPEGHSALDVRKALGSCPLSIWPQASLLQLMARSVNSSSRNVRVGRSATRKSQNSLKTSRSSK